MKRMLVVLVALLMMFACAASAETYKDEVVYALLTPSGEVTGVYVVNGFEATEAAQVTDFGTYANVVNLTGTEELAFQDGAAALSLPLGRFFYQGDLAQNTLPWKIGITYSLDGQAKDPAQLSGAAGHLVITLNAEPVAGMEAFTAGTTLQITVTLDGDKCLNIVSDKATAAWAGKNRALSFVVLPGATAKYEISADVTDFSMTGIQLAGVRMAMDTEMYDALARERFAGSPLADMAGNAITSFLGEMQNAPIVSFADARNTVRSVQFVLLTQEIPEKPAEHPETEPPAAQTPWTRLTALFNR